MAEPNIKSYMANNNITGAIKKENIKHNIFISYSHQDKDYLDRLLHFGGKKSPMKVSEYTLNFSNIVWNKQDDLNYLIIKINENQLLANHSSQIDEKIKSIIGR